MNRQDLYNPVFFILMLSCFALGGFFFLESNKLYTDSGMSFTLTAIYGDDVAGEEVDFPEITIECALIFIEWTLQPNRTYLLVDEFLYQYDFFKLNFTVNETTKRIQATRICENKYFGLAYYKPEIDFGEAHWEGLIIINATRN